MKKYLFHNFLKEPLIYHACRAYWEARLEALFEQHRLKGARPYLQTTFSNGEDFLNGNPIANYHFPDLGRAVRIIQETPKEGDFEVTAWIDTFETETFKIQELVISIQLRPQTEQIALDFIKKWTIDRYEPAQMERFIELKIELEKLATTAAVL